MPPAVTIPTPRPSDSAQQNGNAALPYQAFRYDAFPPWTDPDHVVPAVMGAGVWDSRVLTSLEGFGPSRLGSPSPAQTLRAGRGESGAV